MHKILVVDDESNILEGYKAIFSKVLDDSLDNLMSKAKEVLGLDLKEVENKVASSAYEVLTANSADSAVDIYKKNHSNKSPIKVVFMDVQMPPGRTGFEAAKEIRDINPDAQIVFVTAYSEASMLSEESDTNNTLILKKPYEKIEVLQVASNLTKKYDLKRTYDRFLSQVSHELKTPLVSIVGFSDLLLDDDTISDENKSFIEMINSSAHLLETLVNDMFTFMVLRESKMIIEREVVKVEKFINMVFNKTKHLFSKSCTNIEYILELPQEEISINIDKLRIEQVLTNLLSNSFKYTEEGHVKLGAEVKQDFLIIYVEDTGIGIDAEKFKIALQEFERLEDYSPQPGLGLGLTISHGIVSAHDGILDIVKVKNKGSKFEVRLPLS
jgi:signal transduction histidine kinase